MAVLFGDLSIYALHIHMQVLILHLRLLASTSQAFSQQTRLIQWPMHITSICCSSVFMFTCLLLGPTHCQRFVYLFLGFWRGLAQGDLCALKFSFHTLTVLAWILFCSHPCPDLGQPPSRRPCTVPYLQSLEQDHASPSLHHGPEGSPPLNPCIPMGSIP